MGAGGAGALQKVHDHRGETEQERLKQGGSRMVSRREGVEMLVTMRPGIEPLCDECLVPMTRRQLTGLTVGRCGAPEAFKCAETGCTRAYHSSLGYFDIVSNRNALQKGQQLCPKDGTPMYMNAISPEGIETWQCPQIGCNHSVKFAHDPQTHR